VGLAGFVLGWPTRARRYRPEFSHREPLLAGIHSRRYRAAAAAAWNAVTEIRVLRWAHTWALWTVTTTGTQAGRGPALTDFSWNSLLSCGRYIVKRSSRQAVVRTHFFHHPLGRGRPQHFFPARLFQGPHPPSQEELSRVRPRAEKQIVQPEKKALNPLSISANPLRTG
jgi:hypothetical protein